MTSPIALAGRRPLSLAAGHPCRVKYEQTVADIKAEASKKLSVPLDKLQLFWQDKELTPAYDARTLLEMNLHTGFSLRGYDLVRPAGH